MTLLDPDQERERERRLDRKRPTRIRARNHDKRTGLLSFRISEDGKTMEVWNYRKLRGAERVVLTVMCQGAGELFNTKDGGLLAAFKIRESAAALRLLKLTPMPEECARCKGDGKIENPEPAPPKAPEWSNDPTYRDRYTAWEKEAVGRKTWRPMIECPICRGTGRAVQLESEDA